MTEYWEGFVTTTYSIVEDNWTFILVIFGFFIAILILRGIIYSLISLRRLF